MSTTKHTAEPWQIFQDDSRGSVIADQAGNELAVLPWAKDRRDPEANAARAIACVNACAGVEDPAAALREMRHWATRVASDHRDFGLVLEETREGLAKACLALGGQP